MVQPYILGTPSLKIARRLFDITMEVSIDKKRATPFWEIRARVYIHLSSILPGTKFSKMTSLRST